MDAPDTDATVGPLAGSRQSVALRTVGRGVTRRVEEFDRGYSYRSTNTYSRLEGEAVGQGSTQMSEALIPPPTSRRSYYLRPRESGPR